MTEKDNAPASGSPGVPGASLDSGGKSGKGGEGGRGGRKKYQSFLDHQILFSSSCTSRLFSFGSSFDEGLKFTLNI